MYNIYVQYVQYCRIRMYFTRIFSRQYGNYLLEVNRINKLPSTRTTLASVQSSGIEGNKIN